MRTSHNWKTTFSVFCQLFPTLMSLAAKLTSSSSIRSYLCQKLSIRRCCSRRSCKLLFGPAWKRATLSGNSKSGRESYSKAVYVPLNPRKEIADRAFYAAPMLRHVEVATGIKHVGFAAWQGCQQLQIVKLPPSVISLEDGAFQGCYVLREITAPGCVQYSRRVFAECCSLSKVGIGKEADDIECPCTRGHSWAPLLSKAVSRSRLLLLLWTKPASLEHCLMAQLLRRWH